MNTPPLDKSHIFHKIKELLNDQQLTFTRRNELIDYVEQIKDDEALMNELRTYDTHRWLEMLEQFYFRMRHIMSPKRMDKKLDELTETLRTWPKKKQ